MNFEEEAMCFGYSKDMADEYKCSSTLAANYKCSTFLNSEEFGYVDAQRNLQVTL